MINKLNQLAAMCQGEIALHFRRESSVYETLGEAARGNPNFYELDTFLSAEDRDKCIQTDQYWTLHCYPDSPVSFYLKHGSDAEALIDWVIAAIRADRVNA